MGGRQWLLSDAYALTRKRVLSTLRYGVWASRGWWCDTEPIGRNLLIFKIWTLHINKMSIYFALLPSSLSSYIYFYIMYYSFYIFIIGSSSGWSHHLAFGLLRRSTSRTARFMDFIADQLVRPFGVHFYSALTSSLTSWLVCSVLDSSPTNWSDFPSLHHQLRWGLAS